ncbi:MAG: hypothetical protein AWM53_00207 [Candidatus Dichloromethanomonas elyunquensis]|nr:MAG: hypothetical protein AWM53_00207 [Candidatus Dichloromethanomonas elyunquensis]
MDKLDQILLELKDIKDNQEKMQFNITALKNDNGEIRKELSKLDQIVLKQEMTWQAVQEIRDELTENSVKIKSIDNKVKAL